MILSIKRIMNYSKILYCGSLKRYLMIKLIGTLIVMVVKMTFQHSHELFLIEYYQEIDEPIPKYFPLDRYDDANESGQEKWRKLFDYDRENFVYNKKTDRLLYRMSKLDENVNRYGTKPSIAYVNALSPKVKASSDNSIDQELKGAEFFNWIGENNPFLKGTFLSRFKRN